MKLNKQSELSELELSKLTDQELLAEAKKMKSSNLTNAVFIGILIGIIIFSIVKNSVGMVTLIPLYFAYRLLNDPKNKALEKILKERNLN